MGWDGAERGGTGGEMFAFSFLLATHHILIHTYIHIPVIFQRAGGVFWVGVRVRGGPGRKKMGEREEEERKREREGGGREGGREKRKKGRKRDVKRRERERRGEEDSTLVNLLGNYRTVMHLNPSVRSIVGDLSISQKNKNGERQA